MTTKNKTGLVLVGGCFDILHIGHVNFLEKASRLGNKLTIFLEPDEKVRKLKGPGRPVNPGSTRKKILLSLKFVDKVILLPYLADDEEYFKWVSKLKPAVIAVTKGDPIVEKKRTQAKKIGAELVVISKTKTKSVTDIIAHFRK